MLSLKHELRVMQPQGHGTIVNLSSTVGHKAAPGASVYTASKHAVEGLTKAAALEGAPFGVRVNAVAPGPVATEMLTRFTGNADRKADLIAGVPLKRAGAPRKSPRPSCSSHPITRRTSPARSFRSTAASRRKSGRTTQPRHTPRGSAAALTPGAALASFVVPLIGCCRPLPTRHFPSRHAPPTRSPITQL